MDTAQQQLQRSRERIGEKQQQQEQPPPPSPPSPSSSPSHEFSFTISLHPSAAAISDKAKSPTSTFAIDLSPADDIFFHGHLLPLHLLSHLPVSPRSSTNSLDSFTLPITELLEDQKIHNRNGGGGGGGGGGSSSSSNIISHNLIKRGCNSDNNIRGGADAGGDGGEGKERTKSKSFSLFGRWRKGCEIGDEKEEKDKKKRKLGFDVRHVLKRYVRMVRPLLFFKGRRDNIQFRRQPYSFSGNLSFKGSKQELVRGRRGEYSAPASMRTSPTNSGLLVATATLPSSTSDSTMEELQAAIQAAIAHCKNSIAVDSRNSNAKIN